MYFVWEIYAVVALRHFAQMTLLALMCALYGPSTISALDDAKARRRIFPDAMDRDLREGVPISVFVNRYLTGPNFIFPPAHPPLYNDPPFPTKWHVECSRIFIVPTSGVSAIFSLTIPLRELSVPVVPIEHHEMKWDDGIGRGTGAIPIWFLH